MAQRMRVKVNGEWVDVDPSDIQVTSDHEGEQPESLVEVDRPGFPDRPFAEIARREQLRQDAEWLS